MKLTRLLLAMLPAAALVVFTSPAQAEGTPCESIVAPDVPGAEVTSISSVERHDFVVPPGPFNPEPITDIPAFCEVTVTLAHPGVDDNVAVEVWLPLDTWSGRFQGTGGGGYAAGFFDFALAPAVQGGYSAASTDAGTGFDLFDPSSAPKLAGSEPETREPTWDSRVRNMGLAVLNGEPAGDTWYEPRRTVHAS